MATPNGKQVLQALLDFDEPATVEQIVAHIADTTGVLPSDLKMSVAKALRGGVRYGFVQRTNRKYWLVAPITASRELDGMQSDEDSDIEDEETDDLQDRSRRRRKGRGRGRRGRSRRRSSSRRRR